LLPKGDRATSPEHRGGRPPTPVLHRFQPDNRQIVQIQG